MSFCEAYTLLFVNDELFVLYLMICTHVGLNMMTISRLLDAHIGTIHVIKLPNFPFM